MQMKKNYTTDTLPQLTNEAAAALIRDGEDGISLTTVHGLSRPSFDRASRDRSAAKLMRSCWAVSLAKAPLLTRISGGAFAFLKGS